MANVMTTRLPPALADSDLYVIGHNDDGEPEALVVAKLPYAGCPLCQVAHALFIVKEDGGYACLLCSATKRERINA